MSPCPNFQVHVLRDWATHRVRARINTVSVSSERPTETRCISIDAMQSATRLMIAFLVLLFQSSIGLAVCGCPTAPIAKSAAHSKLACPMGMKTCCPCCKTSGRQMATRAQKCEPTCAVKTPTSPDQATLTAFAPTFQFAILPESVLVVADVKHNTELPVSQNLTVLRIRPPNPRSHRLRAPPAR